VSRSSLDLAVMAYADCARMAEALADNFEKRPPLGVDRDAAATASLVLRMFALSILDKSKNLSSLTDLAEAATSQSRPS